MDDVEATNVLLTVDDDTRTAHVTTTRDHDKVTRLKVNKVDDLVLLEVELNSVVRVDRRVGVADRAPVVGDDVRDAPVADSDLADLEKLVGRLLRGDAVDGEAALDVVKETEVFARLLNGDNVL